MNSTIMLKVNLKGHYILQDQDFTWQDKEIFWLVFLFFGNISFSGYLLKSS